MTRARSGVPAGGGGAGPRMRRWGVPVVAVAGVVLAAVLVARAGPVVVFEAPGTFGPVRVVERSDGLRELYIGQGRARQSAVYPRFPLRLELAYTRVAMIGPALVPDDARVLFVGLGGGAMPSFVRQARPRARIDAVEIDPVVVEAARDWFGFRTDERVAVHTDDGRAFIEAAAPGSWELVVLDAFSDAEIPRALTTREFLTAVRTALAPGGVAVGNLHTGAPEYPAMVATWQQVFADVVEVAVPDRAQRIVVAADGRDLDREALVEAARRWAETVPEGAGADLPGLVEAGWSRPATGGAPVLVDAPGGG